MRISKEHMDTMMKQITLDCNLTEAHKVKDDLYIAPTVVLPGSRVINKIDPFFRVIVYMGTAYVMADEETIPGWEEILSDYPAEWFFNYGRLRKIDTILGEYDREIVDTHIYYLPDEDAVKMNIPDEYMWYREADIKRMKEINRFHNALCYSETQPDVIAVGAPDTGMDEYKELQGAVDITQKLVKAMAGASKDGKYVRQIGIDVLPEYRGEGLACKLVTCLKQQILEDGLLPFYGTGEAHAVSRSVGIKSGFLPAFAEIFVAKKEEGIRKIYN